MKATLIASVIWLGSAFGSLAQTPAPIPPPQETYNSFGPLLSFRARYDAAVTKLNLTATVSSGECTPRSEGLKAGCRYRLPENVHMVISTVQGTDQVIRDVTFLSPGGVAAGVTLLQVKLALLNFLTPNATDRQKRAVLDGLLKMRVDRERPSYVRVGDVWYWVLASSHIGIWIGATSEAPEHERRRRR